MSVSDSYGGEKNGGASGPSGPSGPPGPPGYTPAYNVGPSYGAGPAYNAGPQPPVMMQPNSGMVVVTQQQPLRAARPSSYLGFSIFVLLCCNLLFGVIALIFSVLSGQDYDRNDVEAARSKGHVALGLNIAGLLSSVILIIFIIVYFGVVVGSVFSYG